MLPPFGATWVTFRDRCEEISEVATLFTPLSSNRFCITDVRQSRVINDDTDTDDTQPLQREQFATLAEHVSDRTAQDAAGELAIERLPARDEPSPRTPSPVRA